MELEMNRTPQGIGERVSSDWLCRALSALNPLLFSFS
jgi:hypothetical protein